MKSVGFFYTVFTEKRAVEYSVQELRKFYSSSPIYLVSDGGLDFSYLKNEYNNIETKLEEDTISETFGITAGTTGCDYINGNYREEHYQTAIKKCAYATLDRIERAIKYCNYPDWMVMCDPDCLIRGELSFPDDAKLLGQRVNCCLPKGYRDILGNIEGAIPILKWGASPCVFEVQSFLKALKKFRDLDESMNLLDLLTKEFYGMYAHDVLFPTLFALIGEEEVYNPDIIECHTDSLWRQKSNPLVHSFTEYYEQHNRK
jgi:hypothetical protein